MSDESPYEFQPASTEPELTRDLQAQPAQAPLAQAQAPPPSWKAVSSDTRFQSQAPDEKLVTFSRWHDDTYNYAKTQPDWDAVKDGFNDKAAKTERELGTAARSSDPGSHFLTPPMTPDEAKYRVAQRRQGTLPPDLADAFAKGPPDEMNRSAVESAVHYGLNMTRSFGTVVGQGVENALSGIPRMIAHGLESGDVGLPDFMGGKAVAGFVKATQDRLGLGETREQLTDAFSGAADYWKERAAKEPQTSGVDPALESSTGAKVAKFAAQVASPFITMAIFRNPAPGIAAFMTQHRLATYGEVYNETNDHQTAMSAANRATIGDALFIGQAHVIAEGLGSVLEKYGVGGITAWTAKAAAATGGNLTVNQLTKAAESAANAPPGERAKAFSDAFQDVTIPDVALNAAFGVMAASHVSEVGKAADQVGPAYARLKAAAERARGANMPEVADTLEKVAEGDMGAAIGKQVTAPAIQKIPDDELNQRIQTVAALAPTDPQWKQIHEGLLAEQTRRQALPAEQPAKVEATPEAAKATPEDIEKGRVDKNISDTKARILSEARQQAIDEGVPTAGRAGRAEEIIAQERQVASTESDGKVLREAYRQAHEDISSQAGPEERKSRYQPVEPEASLYERTPPRAAVGTPTREEVKPTLVDENGNKVWTGAPGQTHGEGNVSLLGGPNETGAIADQFHHAFVDSEGNLLDRRAAAKKASEAGLLKPEFAGKPPEELHSHMLIGAATREVPLAHLTPEEQAIVKPRLTQKFLDTFHNLAATKEEMADVAKTAESFRGWYRDAADTIRQIFGADSDRFAHLIAALSPRTTVEDNVNKALKIWTLWRDSGQPTSDAAITKIFKASDGGIPARLNNVIRALSADDPAAIKLSGPKVSSFGPNLVGAMHEVTNDSWMAKFHAVSDKLLTGITRGKEQLIGKSAGYMAISARTREAAVYLTETTGEKWTPAEVQETVWGFTKALTELRERPGEERTVPEILKSKDFDEYVRQLPSIASLLRDEKSQKILRRNGYGPAIDAITSGEGVKPAEPAAGAAGQTEPGALRAGAERAAERLESGLRTNGIVRDEAGQLGQARPAAEIASANRNGWNPTDAATESGDRARAHLESIFPGLLKGERALYPLVEAEGKGPLWISTEDNNGAIYFDPARFEKEIAQRVSEGTPRDEAAHQMLREEIVHKNTGITPEKAEELGREQIEKNPALAHKFAEEYYAKWKPQARAKAVEAMLTTPEGHLNFAHETIFSQGLALFEGKVRADEMSQMPKTMLEHVIAFAKSLFVQARAMWRMHQLTPELREQVRNGVQGLRDLQSLFRQRFKEASPLIENVLQEATKAQAIGTATRDETNEVTAASDRYNKEAGRAPVKHADLEKSVSAASIADAFEKMPHNPDDPKVKATYASFKEEIKKEWDYATKTLGIEIEPTDGDPYGFTKGGQPPHEQLFNDVLKNKHIGVFRGGNPLLPGHPLAEIDPDTGESYNTMFRAIHDIFGHVAGRHEFSEVGEESAWGRHKQMFPPEAVPAMTTETRGQTSWYFNNRAVREGKLTGDFAEQKAGILPDFAHEVNGADKFVAAMKKAPSGALNPFTGEADNSGTGVEVYPEARETFKKAPTATDVQKFLDKNGALFSKHPELRIGWDKTAKGWELNIGAAGTREGATELGKRLDQRSAWDIAKEEEIPTGGRGEKTAFPEYPLEKRLATLKGIDKLPAQFKGEPLPNSVPGEISIVHYSDNELTTVDPQQFGKGMASKDFMRGGKKSAFFVAGSEMKGDTTLFSGKNTYGANVDGSQIYDLSIGKPDPLNWSRLNKLEADEAVKAAGYKGILVETGDGRKIVVMFEPTKVESLGKRTGGDVPDTRPFPSLLQSAEDQRRIGTATREPFYSPLERTLDDQPEKSSPEQLRAALKGTKQVELRETKDVLGTSFEQWLRDNPKATKSEMLDFVRENKVQVKEVEKGAPEKLGINYKSKYAIPEVVKLANQNHGTAREGLLLTLENDGDIYRKLSSKFPEIKNADDWGRIVAADVFGTTEQPAAGTRYTDYQLPGSVPGSYRETLATLPAKEGAELPKGFEVFQNVEGDGGWSVKFPDGRTLGTWLSRQEAIKSQRNQPGQQTFKSTHWDEPNVVLHLRNNERELPAPSVDDIGERLRQAVGAKSVESLGSGAPEIGVQKGAITEEEATQFSRAKGFTSGKYNLPAPKMWFMEEMQSDLHAKGRREGYYTPEESRAVQERNKELAGINEVTVPKGTVPDLPFKGNAWKTLGLKIALRKAIESGATKLGWTTGEQQSERYDLSKQLDKVVWNKDAQVLTGFKQGDTVIHQKNVTEANLASYVGKDAAEKLSKEDATRTTPQDIRSIQGVDLKVGGEGMKGFYDKELVNLANDLVKKWGAKVEDTTISLGLKGLGEFKPGYDVEFVPGKNPHESTYSITLNGKPVETGLIGASLEKAMVKYRESPTETVHSVAITDAMRRDIAEKGQPIFAARRDEEPNFGAPAPGSMRWTPTEAEIQEGKAQGVTTEAARWDNMTPEDRKQARPDLNPTKRWFEQKENRVKPAIFGARREEPDIDEYADLLGLPKTAKPDNDFLRQGQDRLAKGESAEARMKQITVASPEDIGLFRARQEQLQRESNARGEITPEEIAFEKQYAPFRAKWAEAGHAMQGEDLDTSTALGMQRGAAQERGRLLKPEEAEQADKAFVKPTQAAKQTQQVAEEKLRKAIIDTAPKTKITTDRAALAKIVGTFYPDSAIGVSTRLTTSLPPDVKAAIWKYAKDTYMTGKTWIPLEQVERSVATDLGLPSGLHVREIIAEPKSMKKISDDAYAAQAQQRMIVTAARTWVKGLDRDPLAQNAVKAWDTIRGLVVLGHANAPITHAGRMVFLPDTWGQFMPSVRLGFNLLAGNVWGKNPLAIYETMMREIAEHPKYAEWTRAGLASKVGAEDEIATYLRSGFLGRLGIRGNMAMGVLKWLRMQRMEAEMGKLSPELRNDPEVVRRMAGLMNNETGILTANTKLAQVARALQPALFAGQLEGSRWKNVILNPIEAARLYAKADATPAEKVFRSYVLRQNARLAAATLTALGVNAFINSKYGGKDDKINFLDPTQADWLAFKWNGQTIIAPSNFLAPLRLTLATVSAPFVKGAKNDIGDRLKNYALGKMHPGFTDIKELIEGKEAYIDRPLPWVKVKETGLFGGKAGKPALSWFEYIASKGPIPIAQAVTSTSEALMEQGVDGDLAKVITAASIGASSGLLGVHAHETLPAKSHGVPWDIFTEEGEGKF